MVESNGCGATSSESDQLEKLFRRTTENDSVPGQRDRPLDQTGVLRHRRNQLSAVKGGIGQTELLVLFLLAPHEIAGLHVKSFENRVQLGCGRRILQVLDDLGLDAALAEQADRLPRLTSARVVPDDDGHVPVLLGGHHIPPPIRIQGADQRAVEDFEF